jgi:hypothetical protein
VRSRPVAYYWRLCQQQRLRYGVLERSQFLYAPIGPLGFPTVQYRNDILQPPAVELGSRSRFEHNCCYLSDE